MQWFIYILQCSDGSYYVGHTENVQQRLTTHTNGQGANYTRDRQPLKLVYSEGHASRTDAIAREKQIKKWSRFKKQALIEADGVKLHTLAKRRVN
ncbi:MAG: GIY-YIG nuclease family protein [Kiritimatiellales bacterium]|nr:GIY-YIG nuclease family protein [Kiritimatiellales bacterium]